MGHRLVDGAGIGVYEGHAVTVGERRVIDLGVVPDDRLEKAGYGVVVLEDCGDGIASLDRVQGLAMIAG